MEAKKNMEATAVETEQTKSNTTSKGKNKLFHKNIMMWKVGSTGAKCRNLLTWALVVVSNHQKKKAGNKS